MLDQGASEITSSPDNVFWWLFVQAKLFRCMTQFIAGNGSRMMSFMTLFVHPWLFGVFTFTYHPNLTSELWMNVSRGGVWMLYDGPDLSSFAGYLAPRLTWEYIICFLKLTWSEIHFEMDICLYIYVFFLFYVFFTCIILNKGLHAEVNWRWGHTKECYFEKYIDELYIT